MTEAITILHISDMQFGKFHRFAKANGDVPNLRDSLTARLIDDLEHLATHNQLSPDLIICTGDLAEWGMPKEFADAFEFLATLCDHYGLPRSHCVVIPGNHDINRFSCSAYFDECRSNGEEPVFPWFPKWKKYKAAFDTFYEGVPGATFTEDEPWSLFMDEELQVVVAGLNSTMDEGHEEAVNAEIRRDKGHHGLCGEPQYDWFKKRLGEGRFDGWLRIGAVHHNTIRGCREDDQNLRDADLLGGILSEHLHLVLHGHTHEAKADFLPSRVPVYSTGSASLSTSGATAAVPTDVPNQYQFLRIERGCITRFCREYAPRNTPPVFIGDVRQSKSKGDWIIPDEADLSSVSKLSSQANEVFEPDYSAPPTENPIAPPAIPSPPDFYAEPDYIGSHKFVGRVKELEELTDWAKPADPTNLLLFEAIGGNGKSMLTWEWAKDESGKHATQVRDDWAGRFWYSFYERGAIMADFCQRALAYMTGQPLKELRKKKTAELREPLLAQLKARPWLLILDGLERVLVAYHRIDAAEMPDEAANSPTDEIVDRNPCDAIRDEDGDLLRALAAATPSKILVSSRLTPRVLLNPSGQPITGAKRITLPGLRPPDAEQLLRSCGIEGDRAAIQSYLTTNCDNHPLVIGILSGLISNYLPARGNFDAWAADREAGASLDLASLDLIQRRNHILRAALDALPAASRQLLSTLALLSESVDYKTLKAFNPHLPPESEEVREPISPEKQRRWERMSDEKKVEARKQYEADLANWQAYEKAMESWLKSAEYREAPKKLSETVTDLEQRGLLQYEGRTRRHDLHPVVRGVAAGGLRAEDRERYGQRVVDHFSSLLHNPYEQAETLEDLRPGLNVVRTLLKLGHFERAAEAFFGDVEKAIFLNVEAYAEALSLLRPFFSEGWSILPKEVGDSDGSGLANDAALALQECGEPKAAFAAFCVALQSEMGRENWSDAVAALGNISENLVDQNMVARARRVAALGLDLDGASESYAGAFKSRIHVLHIQSHLGQWAEAQATWQILDPMGRDWAREVYRPGDAEACYALFRFWQGTLQEVQLTTAERLASEGKNRGVTRALHSLRGAWRLERGEWAPAADSFAEAVRMGRESGVPDADPETGLALAKHHLGKLAEPRREAERLTQLRRPAHRLLAQLWLGLNNPGKAKHHALAAYKWAWADGEPYVRRYELTKTIELLQQMNVPIPNLPPYDGTKDEPFPWEADVRAAIEKLRAEKEAREKAEVESEEGSD
ncbi:MAG: metallophosphoesterase [Deltaproteobacteria bacterium]|nr:metallophosphoesterase [Deltaproteobacteria bacterium]